MLLYGIIIRELDVNCNFSLEIVCGVRLLVGLDTLLFLLYGYRKFVLLYIIVKEGDESLDCSVFGTNVMNDKSFIFINYLRSAPYFSQFFFFTFRFFC